MSNLILSPHVDDAELAMGGTIAKLVRKQERVHVIAFSTGNPESGSNQQEFCESMERFKPKLGSDSLTYELCYFPCRRFHEKRQEILDLLVTTRENMDIKRVFVPARWDVHQDHRVITEEAIRAFRFASILGYELTWNGVWESHISCFNPLESIYIETKINALARYRSQEARPYMKPELVASLAKIRGMQIGYYYAEGFEVIRWIM